MRWLVGVDAGGTHTRALAISESGEVRRSSEGGAANWTVLGAAVCGERIRQVVQDALPAGVNPAAVTLCIAGYYPPDHATQAEAWALEIWPAATRVIVPDVVGAWAGALGGEPGIVVIAGTGSIAYGRNAAGEEARAGGWGPLFGDQGSAYALGISCLRLLAACVDGCHPVSYEGAALEARVLQQWPELGSDLRTWLRGVYRNNWDRPQIASLAKVVVSLAEQQDPAARRLVTVAALSLLHLIRALEARLKLRQLGDPVPLVLQGGLATSSTRIAEVIDRSLREYGSRLVLREPRYTSQEGAVLLAAEALGGPPALHRLRAALQTETS